MKIEFDSKKNKRNISKHGIPLSFAAVLFDSDFIEIEDTRRNYRESRFIAIGHIEERLFVCVYTWRGEIRRIISLRKANMREINAYYQSE